MRIEINRHFDWAGATPEMTLGEVFDGIRSTADGGGLRVLEFRLDGLVLSPAEELERRGHPSAEFALLEVRVEVADKGSWDPSRDDPDAGLRSVLERVERASEFLAKGKSHEAMVAIASSTGDLVSILRVRPPGRQWVLEAKAILERLGAAVAARDEVAMADLLGYELAPKLRELEGACSP